MRYELAQVNVSRLLAPLDSVLLEPFVSALDEVNAEGDRASGFIWRLQTESGNATDVEGFGWDVAGSHGVIVNLTTWTNTQSLSDFVFSGRHLAIMRRRREWFHPVVEATTALWWLPAGTRPTVSEAEERVRQLRRRGPHRPRLYPAPPLPRPGRCVAHRASRRRPVLPRLSTGNQKVLMEAPLLSGSPRGMFPRA